MPTSRITITADLVRTMQREGTVLLLTRSKGIPFLLVYAVLVVVFVGGAILVYRAGLHDLGVPLGAALVVIGYPIACVQRARGIARRLVRPYDVGGGVASEVAPGYLRLSDPDTGYETTYRTRRLRSFGSTTAVDVAVGARWGVVLVPRVLLRADEDRVTSRGS